MKVRFSPLFATFAALSLTFAPLTAQAQNTASSNLSREQRIELRQLREDVDTVIENILSESQWEEYQEARDDGKNRNRALRQLDLSSEQRVAVERLQELFKQERKNIIEGTQTAQSEEQDDSETEVTQNNNINQNDPLLTLLQVAVNQTPNFLNENQRQTYNTVSPFLQLGLSALSNPEVLNPQEVPLNSTLRFALDQTPNFLNEEQKRYYRAFSPLAELGIDLLSD